MKKKYLLVSEGPTDHVVIKEVANKISSQTGRAIEIVELSPQRDATSGTYPAHGWNAIQSWCKKFGVKTEESLAHLPVPARSFLMRQNWRALVAFNNADGLIIQLDTDIAHNLIDPTPLKAEDCRKTHCANAVLTWMNEPSTTNELYLAMTSHSLETWILATYPPSNRVFKDLPKGFDYEQITDVEERLINLGYPARTKRGRERLKKSPYTIYEAYAASVSANLKNVRQRCSAADCLCNYFEL